MKRRTLVLMASVFATALMTTTASGAPGSHVAKFGKHVCTEIGGVWGRTATTCEIVSGTATAGISFMIPETGILQIDSGATLDVTGAIYDGSAGHNTAFGIQNSGTLNVSGLISNGGTPSTDGVLTNNPGATLNVSGTILLDQNGGGYLANGGTLDNSGTIQNSDIDNFATLTNESGADLFMMDFLYNGDGATIDNSGTLRLGAAHFNNDAGATFTNESSGVVTVFNATSSRGLIDNDGTMDNLGDIENSKFITNESDGTFTNESGAVLNNYDLVDNFGTVTNNGTINNCSPDGAFTDETGDTYNGSAPASVTC